MSNQNILTETQTECLRQYNRDAQKKFIKEHPNYYKEQYEKHKAYRLQKAKEKYQLKKQQKQAQSPAPAPEIKSFTDRGLDAYTERIMKSIPNLNNGSNIIFICVPPV